MSKQPQPQPRIRAARPDDLVIIGELARRIWFAHYPGIITTAQIEYMLGRDYALATLERDLARGVTIDLLELDGEPVGFAAWEPTGVDGEVKLHKIYLDTSLHGLGLGSLLLQHVEDAARSRRFSRIVLQVNKRNEKAIAAYLRNGYIKEKALVVDIGEGFVMDDYLMTKALEAPPEAPESHAT